MKKRGRPAAYNRLCLQCAQPKDLHNPNALLYLYPAVVSINGEIAYKRSVPPSRPIVCDRCFEKVNNFYELHLEERPLDVVEVVKLEMWGERLTLIVLTMMLLGMCLVVIYAGATVYQQIVNGVSSLR